MVVLLLTITQVYNPMSKDLEKRKNQAKMRLEALVEKYLKDICTEKYSPFVCELKTTKEGIEDIKDFVLKEMVLNNMTIGEALREREKILDPNFLGD